MARPSRPKWPGWSARQCATYVQPTTPDANRGMLTKHVRLYLGPGFYAREYLQLICDDCQAPAGRLFARLNNLATLRTGKIEILDDLCGRSLIVTNSFKEITEIYIFAGVLVLESLPVLSAVAIAILENSRINAFSFWRNAGVRTAELIGLRPVAMPTAIGAPRRRWPPRSAKRSAAAYNSDFPAADCAADPC
jgi:hypothetical protein